MTGTTHVGARRSCELINPTKTNSILANTKPKRSPNAFTDLLLDIGRTSDRLERVTFETFVARP
jgi:hypothetical protein